MGTRSMRAGGGAGRFGRRFRAAAAFALLAAGAPGMTLLAQDTIISLTGRVVGVRSSAPAGVVGAKSASPDAVRLLPSGEAIAGGGTVRYPAGHYLLRAAGPPREEALAPADLLFRDGTLQYLPLREFDLGDIETGDLNGDGLPDIAFSIARYSCDSIPGTLPRIWMQNSLHRFYDETTARIPPLSTSTFDLDLLDIEGDGDLDILLCGHNCLPYRSLATLLVNDGTGVFTDETAQRIVAVPEFHFLSRVEPARIDSDAYVDIAAIVLNVSDPQHVVAIPMLLMNTGDGHFWPDTRGRLATTGKYGHFNVEAADFTGDSLVDLLFLNFASAGAGLDGQPALFRNTGNGFMTDETAARLGSDSLRSTRDVATGDVDGDGDRDILDVGFFSGANNPQMRLFRNDGNGFFAVDAGGGLAGLTGYFNDAEFAPIVQDTLPDLFIARAQAGLPATDLLLLNRGDGSFRDSSALLPPVTDFSTAAAVFDYDADGDIDIVTGNGSPVGGQAGQNRLYINQRYSPPTGVDGGGGIPRGMVLHQNYPNPFNPSTAIRYAIGSGASVTVTAVNILGAEVLRAPQGYRPPGTHEFRWDAGALPGGVYFYTVIAGDHRLPPRAAVLLK